MGGGSFDPTAYYSTTSSLASSGKTFARAASASRSGDYTNIAEHLDPAKMKNGMREACFAPGFENATPIIVALDCTGSMAQVPDHIQKHLPELIGLLTEKGVSDHPNVLFMGFDDEHFVPRAAFQMSQFEAGDQELINALNELIIPRMGGGNRGEAYHLAFYAAAYHTRTDEWDQKQKKGFFFIIGDEEPYYDNADPKMHGTKPDIAQQVFDVAGEKEVPMVESVRATAERYHVFVIRPGGTSNFASKEITQAWQNLLSEAGVNPEHVLQIPDVANVIPTIALAIGRINGIPDNEIADVLTTKGIDSSKALVAISGVSAGPTRSLTAKATNKVVTTDTPRTPRTV